ncbi:hypothetical protein CTAYLR_001948 [Chrysophaeum taylorii]|uniref:Gamma carbonic anhydrase family protein n=1 Tax=Chrysophaeum taylorii TaxID=2483200 RepID=A0AAD7XJ95_9STRA|nr:hypothetical protein CTAYLR_001948 [Chrysophaeum taylorii]
MVSRRFANLYRFEGSEPRWHQSAFIAPNATLVGDVEIGEKSSIWYNCLLRGDVNKIVVGAHSNIQDSTVIHVRSRELGGTPNPTIVGEHVTVGHAALLHACTCHDFSFVGMQACLLDFAVVESEAMVAAGALVPMRTVVKAGELWVGRPARKLRDLTDAERAFIRESARAYTAFAEAHQLSLAPISN